MRPVESSAMSKLLLPDDRELLLKEADWVAQDIQDNRAALNRLQAVFVIGTYGIVAWTVGRAAGDLTDDAALWGLRARLDFAMAFTAVSVFNLFVTVLSFEEAARRIILNARLRVLALRLGANQTDWQYRLSVEGAQLIGVWRWVSLLVVTGPLIILMFFCVWFFRPVAVAGVFGPVSWWTGTVATGLGTVMLFLFGPTVRRMIGKDIEKLSRE